jgi:hypothetical protein
MSVTANLHASFNYSNWIRVKSTSFTQHHVVNATTKLTGTCSNRPVYYFITELNKAGNALRTTKH